MNNDIPNPADEPIIQPGDLAAFARGEAGSEVEARIRRSPELLAEAERLKQIHEALLDQFFRDMGPTSEELADYLLDKLSPPERLRVAAYVRQHPRAQDELEMMRRILQPPGSLLDQVRERAGQALAAVAAATARHPALAAQRGEARQLLYEVDGFQISLRILPESDDDRSALSGHVRQTEDQTGSANDDLSGEAWLFRPVGSDAVKTTVAANGLFLFEDLPGGRYGLLLELRTCSLSLDEIVI